MGVQVTFFTVSEQRRAAPGADLAPATILKIEFSNPIDGVARTSDRDATEADKATYHKEFAAYEAALLPAVEVVAAVEEPVKEPLALEPVQAGTEGVVEHPVDEITAETKVEEPVTVASEPELIVPVPVVETQGA